MHLSLRAPSLSLRLGFRGCRFRAQGLELWALRLQDARLGLRVFIGYMAPLEAQQFLWPRSLCYASVPKTTAGGSGIAIELLVGEPACINVRRLHLGSAGRPYVFQ